MHALAMSSVCLFLLRYMYWLSYVLISGSFLNTLGVLLNFKTYTDEKRPRLRFLYVRKIQKPFIPEASSFWFPNLFLSIPNELHHPDIVDLLF